MKIAVRFGHQKTGADGAAPGEYEIIRQYGPYVINGLKSLGHEVLDVTPPENNRSLADSLNYSISKSNSWGTDLFISLHGNSFNGSAMGCEVIYYPSSAKGKNLAINICSEISKLGFKNRGAKADTRGLAELNNTKMTAVIVEPLFVDNAHDKALFNAKNVGYAIVKGITGQNIQTKDNDSISSKVYRVQLGAFTNRSYAEALLKELKSKGYEAYVKEE
ncbi:N-acetylmuramoyl-L-alanine amidase [Clostridium pascui]|uniref:N-acetylmuramoyl-L-alanine amidase n=1 Tax=Clostridium pascui TaxID=46609 RepID=UPI0019578B81|nr:N-acetylmuramoyl-L-alanine amidase [Clostridium pascui]MBM7868894.1 N-acetylmuramoyl-L-alanine amidase [Clostridium pascui]